jgi:secondary thiamine-phosphate synthase enzyme
VKDRFITERKLHTRRERIIRELIDQGQVFTFIPDVSYDRRGRYYLSGYSDGAPAAPGEAFEIGGARTMKTIGVRTRKRNELVDITPDVKRVITESGVREGLCHVFIPHTTAAVTINEKADPDVARDIETALERLVPPDAGYRHAEGNSDAHVKSTLVGASEFLIIRGGSPLLGTWQAVFFCEFDGPRSRSCHIEVIG